MAHGPAEMTRQDENPDKPATDTYRITPRGYAAGEQPPRSNALAALEWTVAATTTMLATVALFSVIAAIVSATNGNWGRTGIYVVLTIVMAVAADMANQKFKIRDYMTDNPLVDIIGITAAIVAIFKLLDALTALGL